MPIKIPIFVGFNSEEGLVEQSYWRNFRMTLDPDAWPDDVLSKAYNGASIVRISKDPYIVFPNEADAIVFTLRYS